MIRDANPSDATWITNIYNHYIRQSIATFEEKPLKTAEMEQRMSPQNGRRPWVVVEQEGDVVGYAYASPWNARAAYRHTREVTVYLSPQHTRNGYGSALYQVLLDTLRDQEVHAVIGGISLPNSASVRLHEKMGFKHVATFPEVGYKFGKWIDVGYWQLTGLTTGCS